MKTLKIILTVILIICWIPLAILAIPAILFTWLISRLNNWDFIRKV